MSSRERIEIDFAIAMERYEELKAIAEDMLRLAKDEVPEVFRMLKGGFGGENGEAFLKKSAPLEPSLLESAQQILKTAENIRYTAELIYRAEKSALRLF